MIEAPDGSVALDLMRTHGDQIDVILLDVTLPGISSREVSRGPTHASQPEGRTH